LYEARDIATSLADPLSPAEIGNKNDHIDARKLADLLRTGLLSAVYHRENGVQNFDVDTAKPVG
jgi:hypothetical protein